MWILGLVRISKKQRRFFQTKTAGNRAVETNTSAKDTRPLDIIGGPWNSPNIPALRYRGV